MICGRGIARQDDLQITNRLNKKYESKARRGYSSDVFRLHAMLRR